MKSIILMMLSFLLMIHTAQALVQELNCQEGSNQLLLEIYNPDLLYKPINGESANQRARLEINGEQLTMDGINITHNKKSVMFSAFYKNQFSVSIDIKRSLLAKEFVQEKVYFLKTVQGVGSPKTMDCASKMNKSDP